MSIAPQIHRFAPELSPRQLEVVGHVDGPLRVVAGPGAGKTRTLTWRPINLLAQDVCGPQELLLLAFGQPAAEEMNRRFLAAARAVGYRGDADSVRISTIHSFCHRILRKHHRRVGLGSRYTVLDQDTQLRFLGEHYDTIFGPDEGGLTTFDWRDPSQVIRDAARFFDRITEEDISPRRLVDSGNASHRMLGQCYLRYERTLRARDCVDFSHLVLWADDVLSDGRIADDIGSGIRYLMVDEYQDVSYLQELVLLRLAEYHHNMAVVGDDDQGIFGFRGAMPDGLETFRDRFPDCTTVTLDVNYRSHPGIIRVCNQLIAGPKRDDGVGATSVRRDKRMKPHDLSAHADYPSTISIMGYDVDDEAGQLADFVKFLARHRVISDYSQVAILLRSVKPRHSWPYQSALESANIPVSCFVDRREGGVRRSGHRGGLNARFPKGRVCMTTMHRSKGLEWPVAAVVCGGFVGKSNGWDHAIARYSRRKPHQRGAPLDQLRQFYVGCTRAENLLILTANQERAPSPVFDHVWEGVPRWPFMDTDAIAMQSFGAPGDYRATIPRQARIIDRVERLVLRQRR